MVNIVHTGGRFGEPNTWRWSKEKLEWGLKNNFIVFDERRKKINGKIVQFDVVGGSYGPIPDDFHTQKRFYRRQRYPVPDMRPIPPTVLTVSYHRLDGPPYCV